MGVAMGRRESRLGLVIFAGGFVAVLATHPERFSGWALWALSPLLFFFLYLLAFRGSPQLARLHVAGSIAGGYALIYALVAGFGDESHREVAQAVYLFLPALGVLAILVCLPVIEALGAVAGSSPEGGSGEPALNALPLRQAALVGSGLLGAWAIIALAGWTNPKVVVSDQGVKKPAAVALVRCHGEDTYLSTPAVFRQPDGVRLQVENDSNRSIWLEYELDGGSAGGGAELIDPGVSTQVITMHARLIGVACTNEGDGTASNHATMTVARD